MALVGIAAMRVDMGSSSSRRRRRRRRRRNIIWKPHQRGFARDRNFRRPVFNTHQPLKNSGVNPQP